MRRVVITGVGAVTPLGVGARRSWNKLIAGQVGVRSLKERGARFDGLPSRVGGLVPLGEKADGGWDPSEWLTKDEQRRMALFTQFAMAAAEEAMMDARWVPTSQLEKEMMGVCVGSGIGNFEDVYDTAIAYEKSGYKKVSPLFVPRLLINLAAGHLAMRWGLQGPNMSPTTACTTGAHAIGDAARLIALGDADIMLAGAAESCIHPLAVAGFARARSLSTSFNYEPESASRPFDKHRDGFVIGEGAGILVLEELEHAMSRDCTIYAEILGYGMSCDASHMTAPLPDGHGAYLAMQRALATAAIPRCRGYPGLPSGLVRHYADLPRPRIDYVNAHATGTVLGDAAEIQAIKKALAPLREANINVSSTKGAIGHLLGAAGAVEAIFTALAIRESILPPTANLEDPGHAPLLDGADAEDVNSRGLATAVSSTTPSPNSKAEDIWAGINFVPKRAQKVQSTQLRTALTNSFGFGGTNASLCLGRLEP